MISLKQLLMQEEDRIVTRARSLLCAGAIVTFAITACGGAQDNARMPSVAPPVVLPTTPSTTARVQVLPALPSIAVAITTTVSVRIEDAVNLWGLDLKLNYTPSIVECAQPEAGTMPAPDISAKNVCANGSAEYIVTQIAPRAPANGSGEIVRITFKCLKAGASPLRVDHLKIVDRDGQNLPRTVANSQIICTP